ncbi:MAG: ABC transporter ATP-binding protein [Herbinix sp.]|nr:ABC transporter ATP-binding protein [Herbinix sp.]
MGELLKIDHLSYTYHSLEGETPSLFDVSFHVDEGEFVAIVGPSGCGKSTLLSLIAGLLSPSSGFIYINGKDIKSSGKNIGYMLQKDHLLDWRNTLKNVTLGLEIQHKLSDNSYVQINDLLNTYGLITFKNSFPSELSGGMRQRAALIRTLLMEPDILLLDEPFSALDYQTRLDVADDIWGIIRNEKKTAILITHDIPEAISMADRVIILSPRPGTVNQILDIKLSIENRTPLAARGAPEFNEYFNLIWKELNHNGKEKQTG